MARVLEMPLQHPSRRPNPYRLRKPDQPTQQRELRCPFGCSETFSDHGRLYLHLLGFHPEPQREKDVNTSNG
jgi:hypothetical protein